MTPKLASSHLTSPDTTLHYLPSPPPSLCYLHLTPIAGLDDDIVPLAERPCRTKPCQHLCAARCLGRCAGNATACRPSAYSAAHPGSIPCPASLFRERHRQTRGWYSISSDREGFGIHPNHLICHWRASPFVDLCGDPPHSRGGLPASDGPLGSGQRCHRISHSQCW